MQRSPRLTIASITDSQEESPHIPEAMVFGLLDEASHSCGQLGTKSCLLLLALRCPLQMCWAQAVTHLSTAAAGPSKKRTKNTLPCKGGSVIGVVRQMTGKGRHTAQFAFECALIRCAQVQS
jgi:hypothetical protein